MNKIYILLLIANTMSLTCMEINIFHKKDPSDQNIPLLPKNNNSLPSQGSFESTALYNESCKLIKNFSTRKLLALVTDFNAAKIDADDMMELAYNKNNTKSAMLFGYLKKYILTKEALPALDNLIIQIKVKKTKNPLAEILEIECPDNTIIQENTYNESTRYTHPAFYTLRYSLMKCHFNENLLRYIYSDNKNIPQNLPKTYDELKKLFYDEADTLLEGCTANIQIHFLLHIIDCGKSLQPQKQESDFGGDIAYANPTLSEQMDLMFWDHKKPTLKRKKIAIICNSIAQYNTKRSSKISPTHEQKVAYDEYCLHSIALPDLFDSNLFDKTKYAFDELESLYNKIATLKCSDYKDIEYCFNSLYNSKNTTV